MRNTTIRFALLFSLLSAAQISDAKALAANPNAFVVIFAILVFALLVFAVVAVADNLIQLEAKRMGADKSGANFSIFPRLSEIFGEKVPDYLATEKVTHLKRGHDINLLGAAEERIDDSRKARTYALRPKNFIGMSPIPKTLFVEGDKVKAGDILFYDKKRPEVKYAAPVSGELVSITRGEKRSIEEIIILADETISYKEIPAFDLNNATREGLVEYMLESGVWPFIRQRPFELVAEPKDTPKAIFISTFDSAPLAPNLNFVVKGQEASFQKGIDVLKKLTPGIVHMGMKADLNEKPSTVFTGARGVKKNWFSGPHPVGNVGIQIHHTDAINKGEVVWVVNPQDVINIGKLFTEQRYSAERIVALAGAEFKTPCYVRTHIGANIEDFVKDNLNREEVRLISGDVLSGTKMPANGHMAFYDDQVTAIFENDNYEMFGWLMPVTPRPSISRSFPGFFARTGVYQAETNTHGEHRAFVVTGQYEQVLPMNIYPQHLFKNILMNDFERIEGLGIYELAPEDVALCEWACTSKQDLQDILRDGLDLMREQG